MNYLKDIAEYYSEKLTRHGESPAGVDWNSEAGQLLRFDQLCKVINPGESDFSVNDLGCGYGFFFEYLLSRTGVGSYVGVDISEKMVGAARSRYSDYQNARFIMGSAPDEISDYGFASGIFNVCLQRDDGAWQSYIESTLDTLSETSRRGFAFNCLTSYSDPEKKKQYLYYADPCKIFDLCKGKYSRQVALLHDYGLYEFTIIVRKES